jgi:hypothetical protein
MRKLSLNQAGASHIVALVGVLVIALTGFVGYRVLQNSEPEAAHDTVVTTDNRVPTKIDNTSDVRKAEKALDSTPIDESVNPDTLNDDINSLQ